MCIRLLGAAALACAFIGTVANAQEITEDGDVLRIRFDEGEGTPLDDFIRQAKEITGYQLTYEIADTKDVRLRFLGEKEIARDQFWAYFQAVLKSRDFVVVPYGDPDSSDIGYYAIRRSTGSVGIPTKPGHVRSQAPVVSSDQLDLFRDDVGLVVTTSFHLRHVNSIECVNLLQTYFTDPMVESVRSLPSGNSIVVTGYAPTVYGVKRLLSILDTKAEPTPRRLDRVPLRHAVATEIRPILEDFLASERRQPRGAQQMVPAPEPAAVVRVDARTNSLLVLATEDEHERIREYVDVIDVQAGEADGDETTRVLALRHAMAQDLADVVWRAFEDPRVRIVADPRVNALLLSGPEERVKEATKIALELDVEVRADSQDDG